MEWIKVLEWVAFLSAMFTVFLYGHTKFYGAIAGIIPAMRAAKQNPVDALRG